MSLLDKFNGFLERKRDGTWGNLSNVVSEIQKMDDLCSNVDVAVPHTGESFWPSDICIRNIYDISKLDNLILKCINGTIMNIPINLLIQLSGLFSDEDNYYIKIPVDLFLRDGIKYINQLNPFHAFFIRLESQHDMIFSLNMLHMFKYPRPIHRESYMINSYYKQKIDSDRIVMDKNTTYCFGFFIETQDLLNRITINNLFSRIDIHVYDKFLTHTFIIKSIDNWNGNQKREIYDTLSEYLCSDVVSTIFSFIKPTYLYYVPCDPLNGKWNNQNINTIINNTVFDNNGDTKNISIIFDRHIDAKITFCSINKFGINQNGFPEFNVV